MRFFAMAIKGVQVTGRGPGSELSRLGETRNRIRQHGTALAVTLIMGLNAAQGAVVLSPVSVVDSDLAPFDATTGFENIINRSGITDPFVSGSTDFDTYFAEAGKPFGNAHFTNGWQSEVSFDLPLTGYIDFDLGEAYTIDRIAVWNISLKDVTFEVFEDLNGGGEPAGEFVLPNHLHFPFSYSVVLLTLDAPHRGRYLRLNILSTYTFDLSDTFAYAMVGEVAVSAITAAPVPSVAIARNLNGEIAVTFTGTLQSASSPGATFTDVPGNPEGTYFPPDITSPQYFRARTD
jgi:hypothetical protein